MAGDDGQPDGFATAWPTVLPLPGVRAYTRIAEHLGPHRVHERLAGAWEVDELAVSPRARRSGLGRRLLDRVTADAGRSWPTTAFPPATDNGLAIVVSPNRSPG